MPHFNDLFDPFRGDVVYGTTGSRGTYIEEFLESQAAEKLTQFYHQSFGVYSKGYMINDYNEPIASGDYRDLLDPVIIVEKASTTLPQQFREVQLDYLATIRRTKYDPGKVGEASRAELAKGDVRLSQQGTQPPGRNETAAMILAVRRACKFGIDYVLNRYASAWVHYVLDEIVMDEVVAKTVRPLFTGTTGVPVTTSELRYLFRNWNRLKTANIRFYLNGSVVPAPWVSDPARWVPYASHRANKYRNELLQVAPSKLQWFEAAVNQNDPHGALHWFFGFTPYGGQS